MIDPFLNQGLVFWVNPLKDRIQRWFRRSVVLKDSKGLIRPEHLSGEGFATEAASVTEMLRFRKVGFALPHSFLGALAMGDVTDGTGHHPPLLCFQGAETDLDRELPSVLMQTVEIQSRPHLSDLGLGEEMGSVPGVIGTKARRD